MKSRVKITHNDKKFLSNSDNAFGKAFAANVFIGFSDFNHDLALFFLNDQVWKNKRKDIVQHQTACVPSINWTFISTFAGVSVSLFLGSSKKFIKPISKALIATCYRKFAMPLRAVSVSTLFNPPKIEASLSVNNAGKICKLFEGLVGEKFNYSSHITSYVNDWIILNEGTINVQAERLSVLAA